MPSATSYGALLDALRGVTWPARRGARGGTAGTHRSRLLGLSPEFTEYRPYRQGEDPRRLDWKLLARTDRAYLRITSDRATLPTMIVVDASASMAFPAGTLDKWAQACRVAMGLAAVAHAAGDAVGIAAAGRARMVLAPRTRRGVLGEIARVLAAVEPAGASPLASVLARAPTSHRVALITDFLDDLEELRRLARERVAAGAEVVAVHIVAREEMEPGRDAITAVDPEAPRVERPLVEETRDAYRDAFERWRAELARAWRVAGASFTEVCTDEPAAHAVRRIARPSGAGDAREP